MSTAPRIIGITGTLGAGKGTVVDYLVEQHGFRHFSVRDFLAEEIAQRHLDLNRDSLTAVANELRASFGPSYITDQLLQRAIACQQDSIIESIRAVGEIEQLKKYPHFQLFAVDADIQLRYQRIQLRKSATDHIDFETFRKNEEREMHTLDPNKQNLAECIASADRLFLNNGDIESLQKAVETAL